VWTNGGGGWTDKFDNTAATYNNAKPVVAQFTNAAAGTNVTVAADGVNVGNVQVGGANYTFSGGTITMTNTTWSVGSGATNSVASTLAGTTGLTKGDTGTLALGASNSYTGTTAVNAGTLTVADGNALGSAGDGTTVAAGAQLRLVATNSGFTVGSEALTISGQGVTTGGALRNAAGNNTWQGNITLASNATIGAAGGTSLTLDVAAGNAISASGYSLTFDGAGTNRVLDSINLGAGAVTKIGTGRTILAASNSYSGGTTLSAGTLTISNAHALGSGNLTVNGGTLDLAGNNVTAANLGGTGGTISLGAGTLTAAMSSAAEYSGAITGSGGLVKTGASFLTLNGNNTYSGGTVVDGGTLYVTGSGTLGDAAGTITISNAVVDLRNQQTRTGTITMIGQDARLLSGDVNNPGSVVNNGGALQFGGGLISASISGTGGLNVTGGGSLNASNSYTGETTISGTTGWYGANTLFVDNAHALGAASGNLTMSGGILSLQNNTVTRSGNLTISGGTVQAGTFSKSGSAYDIQGGNINVVLAGTAGVTKSGTNGAGFNAANTYTGATTVEAGTLVVNGSINSATTVQSGATLGGSGTVASATIQSGGTIGPGNSPGTLTITNGLTWMGGGNYNWQIFGVSGAAGQTNTWDLINVTGGTWDITGLSSTNKFNINLWSLSGLPDTSGALAGFDATQNYSWMILASSGLTGTFNTNLFNINTAAVNGTGGFAGGTGLFSLEVDENNDLFLNYTGGGAAVPEPGTWAAAALLAAGIGLRRVLRRKPATP
jgi:autotransporter-associated beta strand protein